MCSITLFHYVRINCVFLNKDCCFVAHAAPKKAPIQKKPARKPRQANQLQLQLQSEILRIPSVHRNAGIDSGIDCGLDIGIVIELDLDISRIFLEGNLVGEASV